MEVHLSSRVQSEIQGRKIYFRESLSSETIMDRLTNYQTDYTIKHSTYFSILKNDKIYDANIKKKALLLHYC